MAQITINIPDIYVADVRAAFLSRFNYANAALAGETENQFLKRMITNFIKEVYQLETAGQASVVAYNQSLANTSNITID